MLSAGSKLIPVLIILKIFLLSGRNSASEITFYTLPLEKSNSELKQGVSWQTPRRQWISLNGEWQLKNPDSNGSIGNVNSPFAYFSSDKILFEKQFELADFKDSRIFLNANWINGRVLISVNGQPLFSGSRNFMPMRFEVPAAALKLGENQIQIELDPYGRKQDQLPAWMPINLPKISSGILSSIYLEIAPAFHVKSVDINSVRSDTLFNLTGKILLSDPFKAGRISGIGYKYGSGEKSIYEGTIEITDSLSNEIEIPEWQSPIRWSPEKPQTCWLEIELDRAGKPLDVYRQEFTLRSLEIQNNQILLNGKSTPINGINYVYQTPDGNQLFDLDLIKKDLLWIKGKGFNAVRVVLNPLPEMFYKLCDETGLLVFQDLPFVFMGLDKAKLAKWKQYYNYEYQLTNRFSSLAAVGLAYEIDGESPGNTRALKQFLDSINPPPLLRYASSPNSNQDMAPYLDFQISEVIHRNDVEKGLNRLMQKFSGHPFIPSAFAKPVSYRADSTTITYDLFQIESLFQYVTQLMEEGKIAGQFILTYSDFYLDFPSLQNALQEDPAMCKTGLVDLKRNPRLPMENIYSGIGKAGESDAGVISEAKSAKSYLYIIIGLFNLFFFLYLYRRFSDFRNNVNYSMKKPHGFFVNLQERIIIPYGQSLLLIFGISLNGAIIWSSLIYYFRNNLILDYILSLLFFSPGSKQWVSQLIWNQPLNLLIGMIFTFIFFYGLAIFIKVLSLFGEARVTFRQAVAVSAWSAVPMLLLLPIGIVFYNLLLTMKSYWIMLVVLLYFHVWIYLRWVTGTRVLTEKPYFKILGLFTFLGLFFIAIVIIFYQYQINLFEHLRYAFHLLS